MTTTIELPSAAELAQAEPPALDSTEDRAYARRSAITGAGVLADYAEATNGSREEDETTLSDLLADLMHTADALGIDFHSALATAEPRYAEEARGDA